ncbi:pectate lyase [Dysgonomonas sp. 520]|uniref:pectate lyase n=1 Tax=Dysgonomonas sp. 520 TaxID=2302931 RepID=UPI0013D4A06D|nr:pectate lyase [Dysgonomonas sp. 520]NDW08701.1 pectate lyase [Dysgonomonas sp. 520]
MKKILFIILTIILNIHLVAQTPAFPGAEGGGMYTKGGRGGRVYYVNTLEDNNTGSAVRREGSLRWCLNQKEARTILFKVGGTIRLNSQLSIKNGNVTVAGQSAPGDGICIADYPVMIAADNVILRYLRIRMGDEKINVGEADGADALGGRGFKNVIVDHCSVSWCTDECSSFYDCNDFTMQWCIISESLRLSKHDKGPHGYGGIWGGTNSTFHHNLMAHHDSRNPRLGPGKEAAPHTETVDMRNNVIYNWVGNSCYGAEAMRVNIVNNYYKPGPSTPTGTSRGRLIAIDRDKNAGSIRYNIWGQFYIDGNVVDGTNTHAVNTTKNNWAYGVYNQFHSSYGTVSEADKAAMRMDKPFVVNTVSTHTAQKAYEKVLEYAGASLKRDAYDARIVNETRTGTAPFKGLSKYNGYSNNYPGSTVDWKSKNYPKAGIIDSQSDLKPSDAGDDWSAWPTLIQGEVLEDTDRDGIPDGWLSANYPGKTATDINDEGYTYLEIYLNNLVKDITEGQNKETSGIVSESFDCAQSKVTAYYDNGSDSINIQSQNLIESISIYDITGGLIKRITSCNEHYATVNTGNYPSNFYIVKVTQDNGLTSSVKVMK